MGTWKVPKATRAWPCRALHAVKQWDGAMETDLLMIYPLNMVIYDSVTRVGRYTLFFMVGDFGDLPSIYRRGDGQV